MQRTSPVVVTGKLYNFPLARPSLPFDQHNLPLERPFLSCTTFHWQGPSFPVLGEQKGLCRRNEHGKMHVAIRTPRRSAFPSLALDTPLCKSKETERLGPVSSHAVGPLHRSNPKQFVGRNSAF